MGGLPAERRALIRAQHICSGPSILPTSRLCWAWCWAGGLRGRKHTCWGSAPSPWHAASSSLCQGAVLFLVWGLPCGLLPKEAGTLSPPVSRGGRDAHRGRRGGCCEGARWGQSSRPRRPLPGLTTAPRASGSPPDSPPRALGTRVGSPGGPGPLRRVVSAAQTVPRDLCPPPRPETIPSASRCAHEAW